MKPCFSSSEPDLKSEERKFTSQENNVEPKQSDSTIEEVKTSKEILVENATNKLDGQKATEKVSPEVKGEYETTPVKTSKVTSSPTEIESQENKSKSLPRDTSEEPMEVSLTPTENESYTEDAAYTSTPEELNKDTLCVTPSSKGIEGRVLEKAEVTPKKTMSPKQLQRLLESEKKKKQKQFEREEREKKKQEEKEEKLRLKQELLKQKQEKEEQKKKEKEEKDMQKKKEREEKELQKKKEREEKEQKRKEKEEKEEQRRKEKEQERLKKQQEMDEKNKEKQKQEEQKQKAAAAFASFFVPRKHEVEEKKPTIQTAFMPFEVKSDMRLAPAYRSELTLTEKDNFMSSVEKQDASTQTYLCELKSGKKPRKSEKTWPYVDSNDDVIIVEEDTTLGDSVYEQKPKMEKKRAKFLKFHENRRPAYYGTWRKKSKTIKPRRPFVEDKVYFDYEVDSDDDWEEEEQGESITASDGEDKENDSENEYEVDNEFFVPHGHLSEDEIDDEETGRLSPEAHKAKLKLLKNEFDEEMKSKTQKIKPRVIGCIWYKKDEKIDEAIDRFLQPFAIITNKPIIIKRRDDPDFQSGIKKKDVPALIESKLIPTFLQLIHGSTKNKKALIKEFLVYLKNKQIEAPISKNLIVKSLKKLAQWTKCPEEGPLFDKYCWYVSDDVRSTHGVKLDLPNKWQFVTKEDDI